MDKRPETFVDDKKPWGGYKRYTLNEPSTVKILWINKESRFSLQTHEDRDELWVILQGNPIVTIGDTVTHAKPHDEFWSPRGTVHRMEAQETDVEFLEISFGHFDETDIERIADDFGRA